jgi:hypothetical protein
MLKASPIAGSQIARFDGLRRSGNVLATSELSKPAALPLHAARFCTISAVRIKTSVELTINDFENEVAIHIGLDAVLVRDLRTR